MKVLKTLIVASSILLFVPLSGLCQEPAAKQPSAPQPEVKDSSTPQPAAVQLSENRQAVNRAMSSVQKWLHAAEGFQKMAEKDDWPSEFKYMAERNLDLANELVQTKDKITETEANIGQLRQKLSEIQKLHEKSEARVAKLGLTPAVAALLQKERIKLVKLQLPRRSSAVRRAEMARINRDDLNTQDLKDQIEMLNGDVIDEYLADSDLTAAKRGRVKGEVQRMLGDLQGLIDDLRTVNARYMTILGTQSYAERALRLESKEFIDFINVNLLWSRSNPIFGMASITFLDSAVLRFLNPQKWSFLKGDLFRSLKRDWLWWGILFLIPLGWFIFRLKKKKLAEAMNRNVGKVESDSIIYTFGLLGVAIVSAGALPLFIGLASLLPGGVPGCHEFTRAISLGICAFAWIIFFAWLAREILRPGGSGELHFGWTKPVRSSVRRVAWFFMVLVAPMAFLLTMINAGFSVPVRGSLGRIIFILQMLALALIFSGLFRRKSPVFAERGKQGFLAKTRVLWFALSLIVPLALLAVSYWGYYRSAFFLGADLIFITILIGVLISLRALLVRWNLIVARRHEAEEKNCEDEKEAPTPEKMKRQTAILIQVLILILGLAGAYWIIGDEVPIVKLLNSIILWTYNVGVDVAQNPIIKSATLGSLVLCLLIIGLTVLIVKNLPGVLDMLIFKRVRMTTGSRHAYTLIIKYVIAGIGITMAMNAVGIGWSKFQWLLAALTVGLGFGLQDIVANFASGIIILFERPINIGDTITINGISGTVTRLRIRATTVTDWDKKEVVIPNKSFLTSNIINWSLTNQLGRVVIPVGVAYGSDARKTEEILLRIAGEHPLILKEPAPSVIFSNFGDSSLDFDLRVFVQNPNRMTVIHQLHQAINDAFNKEGLEIPFPQRDAHLDTPKPLDVRIVDRNSTGGD